MPDRLLSVPATLDPKLRLGAVAVSIVSLKVTVTLNVPVPASVSVIVTSLATTLVTVGFSVSTLNSTLGV